MWRVNKKIKRMWRGRGHGVHSPFAFRFITCVLRLKGRYYASDELDSMPDPGWHTLLFRVVCEFEPESVACASLSDTENRAIALADSRVIIGKSNVPGVVMRSRKGKVTLYRDIRAVREEWNHKRESMSAGMTFTDGYKGVAVERPDLPRQDFEINFRL